MKIYICDFKNEDNTDKFLYKKGRKIAHILYDWLDISKGGSPKGDKLILDDRILKSSKLLEDHEIVKYKLLGYL